MSQFLEGLAFAHEPAMPHRDIQSSHFLIDAQHKVRLIGLGVAQESSRQTWTSTPSPAAPCGSRPRTSCAPACCCHRILSGKRPLEQADLHAVVQQMQPQARK